MVATGAGVGLAPFAPGTAGSAVAALAFVALAALPVPVYLLSVVGLTFLGIWAADEAERVFDRSDDGRIVVDELAGQLITLAPLIGLGQARSPLWVVTGFVIFRVLDIWKPGPVRRLEREVAGGAGVMLDDVAAGALGALVLTGLVLLFGRGSG